ncbi:NARF domain-containing protein [Chryseobacterium sp.]|uniref:NARF domain-containing protein n=1 Tax=Chryseobacterium sp. TaxID=1871047 RepID=UPI0024E1DF77|nr:NARF domain-containing protein [Chryseobacterium sp.]
MRKINFFILLLLFPILMFAKDDSLMVSDINKRVITLEQYKEMMAAQAKMDYEKSAKKLEDDIDEKTDTILWTFGSFAVLALAALGVNALNYWNLNKKVDGKINSKIEGIIEQKREDILSMVKDEEYERKLKQAKNILVISSSREAEEEIKHTFSKFNFKNVKYRVKNSFQTIPENDIVVFNNLNGELDQAFINSIVATINDDEKCYIAYTITNLDRHEQFNFANSRFTLYHNLLNTLKFSDLNSQI